MVRSMSSYVINASIVSGQCEDRICTRTVGSYS